jgi:hypothetical protein
LCVPSPNTYTRFIRSIILLHPSFFEVVGFFVFDRDTPPIKLGKNVSDLFDRDTPPIKLGKNCLFDRDRPPIKLGKNDLIFSNRDTPPIKLGKNLIDLINNALLGFQEFIMVYFDSYFASDLGSQFR